MIVNQKNQHFKAGVSHFNQKEFYEAHEEWEEIWLVSDGDQKLFLQTLILIAGAGVHFQKDRPNPALRLLKLAQNKMEIIKNENVYWIEKPLLEDFVNRWPEIWNLGESRLPESA